MPKNRSMKSVEGRVRNLTGEFFAYYPDYRLCHTLAVNVENGVTSYGDALSAMSGKARAAELNREAIEEKLNLRSVSVEGRTVRIWRTLPGGDPATGSRHLPDRGGLLLQASLCPRPDQKVAMVAEVVSDPLFIDHSGTRQEA